jgi:hypothetical protein
VPSTVSQRDRRDSNASKSPPKFSAFRWTATISRFGHHLHWRRLFGSRALLLHLSRPTIQVASPVCNQLLLDYRAARSLVRTEQRNPSTSPTYRTRGTLRAAGALWQIPGYAHRDGLVPTSPTIPATAPFTRWMRVISALVRLTETRKVSSVESSPLQCASTVSGSCASCHHTESAELASRVCCLSPIRCRDTRLSG